MPILFSMKLLMSVSNIFCNKVIEWDRQLPNYHEGSL